MKTNLFRKVFALVAFLLCATAANASDPFDELMSRNDVEVVYVSKSLISAVKPNLNLNVGSVYLGNQIHNIESAYVIESSNGAGAKACLKALDEFKAANPGLEVLMKSKSDGEENALYGLPMADSDGRYSKLLIFIADEDDVTIVVLSGNVSFGHQNKAE